MNNEFEMNWGVVAICIVGVLAMVFMNAWMDVSFEVEKARAAKETQP